MPKDIRGVEIEVGDFIAYGKSNRNNLFNLGKVISITEKGVEVLGKGNTKTGLLDAYYLSKRILVLPQHYEEY